MSEFHVLNEKRKAAADAFYDEITETTLWTMPIVINYLIGKYNDEAKRSDIGFRQCEDEYLTGIEEVEGQLTFPIRTDKGGAYVFG